MDGIFSPRVLRHREVDSGGSYAQLAPQCQTGSNFEHFFTRNRHPNLQQNTTARGHQIVTARKYNLRIHRLVI